MGNSRKRKFPAGRRTTDRARKAISSGRGETSLLFAVGVRTVDRMLVKALPRLEELPATVALERQRFLFLAIGGIFFHHGLLIVDVIQFEANVTPSSRVVEVHLTLPEHAIRSAKRSTHEPSWRYPV